MLPLSPQSGNKSAPFTGQPGALLLFGMNLVLSGPNGARAAPFCGPGLKSCLQSSVKQNKLPRELEVPSFQESLSPLSSHQGWLLGLPTSPANVGYQPSHLDLGGQGKRQLCG